MAEYDLTEITCYREWLKLDKKAFRILFMLADVGEFHGTLSDMCRYFNISAQTSNRKQLQCSIEQLATQGYIECTISGRTYTLRVIPKEHKISVPLRWAAPIKRHEYTEESVAWEKVIKVYLWIINNRTRVVTNAQIAKDLHISEDTVIAAKNLLVRKFGAVVQEIVRETLPDGEVRNSGQILNAAAAWSE